MEKNGKPVEFSFPHFYIYLGVYFFKHDAIAFCPKYYKNIFHLPIRCPEHLNLKSYVSVYQN